MRDGQVRVFVALGGNFVAAAPDTDAHRGGAAPCRLTVQISTKLNRSHVIAGEQALILPCLGRTEPTCGRPGAQFVTVEDSMGMVHLSRGRLAPASEHLLSEVAIVCRLARAAARGSGLPGAVGGVRGGLRPHPRPHRTRGPRLRGLQRPGAAAGRLRPAPPARATSAGSPTATGLANFTANPLDEARRPRRADCCCRRSAPTTSTTPPSTAWTTATAASTGAAGRLPAPRRPRRARAGRRGRGRHRQRVRGRRGAQGAGLPGGGVPDAPRVLRRLLPGDQRPCASGLHGGHQQHPHLEVHCRPAGTRLMRGEV